MLKRLIIIALILAVVGVVIHDLSIFASAQRALGDTTYDLATWAAHNTEGMKRDKAAAKVAAEAARHNVTVYQYDQSERQVEVWTRAEVPGTIVAGPIVNLVRGVSFPEALSAPFEITDYHEAGIS